MTRIWRLATICLAAALGCTKTGLPSGSTTATGSQSSSGAGSSSTSGGTTQGTGSAGGSGSTSGGAGTTGSSTGSPFVDGGYVYCSLPNAADAGPNGDGGLARWMCRPGTYFCDLSGDVGNCFACRSDADCADRDLPTYDPLKPRCDLDSGIAGYQSFCQECLDNADCADSRAGSLCDTNPTYPLNALEPPIEDVGFETCGRVQTDCRLEGGPDCHVANQICDVFNGQCEARSTSCTTDQDCAGLLAPPFLSPSGNWVGSSSYLVRPYCVNGTCNSCDGGVCPTNTACQSDGDCGNPTSSPTGLRCEPLADAGVQCVCTDSSQCSGFWPACIGLDAGYGDDAGQPIGACSCDSDGQCGDGGLACLPPQTTISMELVQTIFGAQAGRRFCGVPCTSPDFPSCWTLTGQYDICDLQSRVCGMCSTDEACVSSFGSGGLFCDVLLGAGPGDCGCILDADCPAGDSCLSEDTHSPFLGTCIASFSRCTPESCGGLFCNWESGACVNLPDFVTFPSCVNDADCAGGVCAQGECAGCRDDVDCLHAGPTRATFCCSKGRTDPACLSGAAVPNVCVNSCATDQDCVGNVQGPSCLSLPSGGKACGCSSDADCAENPSGPHCDTNPKDNGLFGQCTCLAAEECSAGWSCERMGSPENGICEPYCDNGKCPSGFACDSSGTCRPECVDSRDCDGGLGCSGKVCEPCAGAADCAAGTVCLTDGLCHASCDAGSCPKGERCDGLDEAGGGSNVCYQCVSAADCPDDQGCDSRSHSCGTCRGPTAQGGPFDCPPDAICSNYWLGPVGACLPNCDRELCPADRPICAALPSLTPDHKYCFGCLQDVDCGDAGAWCDQSFKRTFTCQEPE